MIPSLFYSGNPEVWSMLLADTEEIEAQPMPEMPEVPPEVWNDTPVDAEQCMAAIRAMCR